MGFSVRTAETVMATTPYYCNDLDFTAVYAFYTTATMWEPRLHAAASPRSRQLQLRRAHTPVTGLTALQDVHGPGGFATGSAMERSNTVKRCSVVGERT